MANGDAAAAAGLPVVPSTSDIRMGYDWINKLADVVAGLMGKLTPVGTSIEGHWTTAPSGYFLEQGQILTRASYPALFGVIGVRYNTGGETALQFRLPDSRGRVAVAISSSGQFATLGARVGTETVALHSGHNGPHSHATNRQIVDFAGVGIPPNGGVGGTIGNGVLAVENRLTDVDGSGTPHPNVQPSIVVNRAIKY